MKSHLNPDQRLAKQAAFAITCRRIRLFLAANGGSTEDSIRLNLKLKSVWKHLEKMEAMGLVKQEQLLEGGKMRDVYYVIPQ